MRITDGSEASHPLLAGLVEALSAQQEGPWDVRDILTDFWSRVSQSGTPLLQPLPDGRTRITFLWREPEKADYNCVWLDDGQELALFAGTDVWFVERDVPGDYVDAYCFTLGLDGEPFNEDAHEPWPMSFPDEFNTVAVTEEDAAYPRNVVAANGLLPRGELAGRTRILAVPCSHLDLPTRTGERPDFWPVWVYEPPALTSSATSALPVTVIINGQLLESSDALAVVDAAIASGDIPPTLLVASSHRPHPSGWADGHAVYEQRDYDFSAATKKEHDAWGWRNGYGPSDISEFLVGELLPALHDEFAVEPVTHLISWDTGAPAALATANGSHGRVGSVTLLSPHGLRADRPDPPPSFPDEAIARELTSVLRSSAIRVAVSRPTPRTGTYSWTDDGAEALCSAIDQDLAGAIFRIPLSDPNIAAAGHALTSAIQFALQQD